MHTLWTKKVRFKRTKEGNGEWYIRIGCYRETNPLYNKGHITMVENRYNGEITIYSKRRGWKDYTII